MWKVSGIDLRMTQGDFGLALPVTVTGTTLAAGDSVIFTVKRRRSLETVLEKDYTEIAENTFSLVISEEETARLMPGEYVYILDWYQDGVFMCNIISNGGFTVEGKPR